MPAASTGVSLTTMRPTILILAIYAVVILAGMTFVATDQVAVDDALLFLSLMTGPFAVAIGFSCARRS